MFLRTAVLYDVKRLWCQRRVKNIYCSSQRELQLEDVQSRLQQDLRERMALDGRS